MSNLNTVIFTEGNPVKGFFGPYRFLSNFWPVTIEFEQRKYPTVEHAYQAAKSIDPHHRDMIRVCPTPGQAKRLGKKIKLRPDWDNIKISIMLDLLRQKFKEPLLRRGLLDTKARELIEENTWGDTFWGIFKHKGKNVLGKLLMLIRIELRNSES